MLTKKKTFLLLIGWTFGLLLGLAVPARAAVNLSNTPGTFSTCPRIAVDSRGVVHVIWVEMYSIFTGDCFYVRSEDAGRTWAKPVNLSRNSKVYAYGERICDIAVDGLGRVYAVWIESNILKLARFVDGDWKDAMTVASARANMNTPKIAATPQGDLHIAWWTEDGTVFARSKVGGAWEDSPFPSRFPSTFSDIGAGPSGDNVYIVWDASNDIFLVRAVEFRQNLPPVADFTPAPGSGDYPLNVSFDASASYDPDGKIVAYDWAFGDGKTGEGKAVRHTYAGKGRFTARLTVKDDRDGRAVKEAALNVLNLFPPLNIRWETVADRALFFTRYITDVRWEKNPANDSIATIVGYRIYRKRSEEAATAYRLIEELNAGIYTYRDYDVEGIGLYTYTVTAVDSQGHQSPIESNPRVPGMNAGA